MIKLTTFKWDSDVTNKSLQDFIDEKISNNYVIEQVVITKHVYTELSSSSDNITAVGSRKRWKEEVVEAILFARYTTVK